jgi:Xaa-Pro aminopeptidase
MISRIVGQAHGRIEQLRAQLANLGLDAFLITSPPHLRYFSNFTGANGIGLVTNTSADLITDGRYSTQVRAQTRGWRIYITDDRLFDEVKRRKILQRRWRIGFDGNSLPFLAYQSLKTKFPDVKFLSKVGIVEKIVAVKDTFEIHNIERAISITDAVFTEILDRIRPGVQELDMAAEISCRQRKHGAQADAFEIIVASGPRSSLPHGRASSRKIQKGDFVTLDFGCVYEGYYSDLTRTVVVGKPTSEQKKIYHAVLDAQTRAIEKAKNGMLAKDLDAVARFHITKQGYGRYFSHSLGHGLGLQIHEPPRISSRSSARLQTGNVITIEPGIYIPKKYGVRIEDDVLITNGRCEVLTHSPKELLVL